MPLVRISLRAGQSAEYQRAIGEAVHQAMVETINVPAADRFQIITEHAHDSLIYDPSYLSIDRTEAVVFIQITLNIGRTLVQKQALYARIADQLVKNPGIRPQDVLINLVEVPRENWSFGNGDAQYAPK